MNLRRLGWTALMGLSLVSGRSVWAGEPARLGLPSVSPIPAVQVDSPQKLADAIAAQLQQAGTLQHYTVDITVKAGVVELTGSVTDQPQRDEVIRLVQGVPGVTRVSDRMTMKNTVVPVARLADKETPKVETLPIPMTKPGANNLPAPVPGNAPPGNAPGNAMPEPHALYSAHGAQGYAAQNAPNMPPYAWPTYAPHNNYSRVGYPLAYPNKSWPFIGPLYPFPKVPLGWRSVKLEWDDGHWWYSRVGCKHDWWKVRYW